MENSIVEQDFINWCHSIHPDINPYIFIHRHRRYFDEYLPLIENDSTQIHQYLHSKKPNINFSLKGRVKSKRSFLIKSFICIAENIENIFSQATSNEEREKLFNKYFKFLLNENPKKFEELKKITFGIIPTLEDYRDSFRFIFQKLSQEEKNNLIRRLGRTEDTYAYRLIIHSVDFPISSIISSSDGKFHIIDNNGNKVEIAPAIRFNPETDLVTSKETDETFVVVDGRKELFNERNLLYPENLPLKKHNLENAQKDENGNLFLLCDSFIRENNSPLNIIDIKFNPVNNSVFVIDSNGESRNLTSLLQRETLSLRKFDENSLIKELYEIDLTIQEYYKTHKIQSILSRRKDYIEKPKPDTHYQSIHDSCFHKDYGYTMEAQERTLDMEEKGKDENTRIGHDVYKQKKLEKYSNNIILKQIIEKDNSAFDSSTPTLMKILEDKNVELSELLGKYILTTSMTNGVSMSFQPTIDVIFDHTFSHTKAQPRSTDNSHKLDFSNYKNFISSRMKRNSTIQKDTNLPDIYED